LRRSGNSTSPIGRGRRVAPGEGLRSIVGAAPPHPILLRKSTSPRWGEVNRRADRFNPKPSCFRKDGHLPTSRLRPGKIGRYSPQVCISKSKFLVLKDRWSHWLCPTPDTGGRYPAAPHPTFKPHPMQGWTPDFIPKLTDDAVAMKLKALPRPERPRSTHTRRYSHTCIIDCAAVHRRPG
jgi:hypothetical protein